MQFYLKPTHYSKTRSFTIRDEHKNRLFRVKGRFFMGLRQLEMRDMNGELLYRMRRKYDFTFMKKYIIEDEHQTTMGVIQRTYGFFAPKFKIILLEHPLVIEGSLYQHDFSLMDGEAPCARIQKQVFPSGDAYEIDITREEKPLLHLFAMITVDQFLHERRKHRAAV